MMIKQLLILACLWLVACSHPGNYLNGESYTDYRATTPAAIDFTLNELNRQYIQADHAVIVNDAEKVYLQRFIEDLENKRKKTSQD